MSKKALLVISFGTSYDDTREKTIGAIEGALHNTSPDRTLYRAFTSGIVKRILAKRGMMVDDITEAMDKIVSAGITDLIVQPTYIIPGLEYDDSLDIILRYTPQFETIKIGNPLLFSADDCQNVAKFLVENCLSYGQEGKHTAFVYMGHGTQHPANSVYKTLQHSLDQYNSHNIFIGTVEAKPDIEDMLNAVKSSNADHVMLAPLMVVAGDHAINDMASEQESSWKSCFEAAGYSVTPVLKGLGEYAAIQEIYVQHMLDAMAE